MLDTSAKLLRLLSLLQSHREWSGAALADRLGVTPRTIRRDLDRLRELGYPVNATPAQAAATNRAPAPNYHPCCWTTTRRWPSP